MLPPMPQQEMDNSWNCSEIEHFRKMSYARGHSPIGPPDSFPYAAGPHPNSRPEPLTLEFGERCIMRRIRHQKTGVSYLSNGQSSLDIQGKVMSSEWCVCGRNATRVRGTRPHGQHTQNPTFNSVVNPSSWSKPHYPPPGRCEKRGTQEVRSDDASTVRFKSSSRGLACNRQRTTVAILLKTKALSVALAAQKPSARSSGGSATSS